MGELLAPAPAVRLKDIADLKAFAIAMRDAFADNLALGNRAGGEAEPANPFARGAGDQVGAIGPDEGEQVLAKLTKVGSRFEREDIGTVRLQPIVRGVAAVI